MHIKRSLDVVSADGFLPETAQGISNSVGRVNAALPALLIGQEKVLDWLRGPDETQIKKEIAHLKKDKRLKNTLVRLGHVDPIEDYKRLYSLPENNLIDKILGTPLLPLSWIGPTLTRADNYNPLTDTATVYSGIPEVTHHELGHARDFNTPRKLMPKAFRTVLPAIEQSLINLIPGAGMAAVPGLSTQYLESRANTEAEKGYKKDKTEFRRRLWPARGTYWAGLAAAASLFHPEVRKKVVEFVNNPEDSQAKQHLKLMALGLAPMAVGALGGRALAELRNVLPNAQ